MSFRAKLLICLLSLVAFSCGILLWLSLRHANDAAFELIREKVYAVAVSATPLVDGDLLSTLTDPEQDGSEEYLSIRDVLRKLREDNAVGDLPLRFVYIVRPKEDGSWEYVVDAEEDGDDKSYLGDIVEFENESDKPPLERARVDNHFATDSFGTWLSAFSPIRDGSGKTVAVLGVDVDAKKVTARLHELRLGGFLALGIALAIATLISLWLSGKVTAPLRELQGVVERIGKGDLATRAPTNYEDEFGSLGFAINEMAEGLEERESLKGALVHYVRSQAADSKLWNEEPSEPEADASKRGRRVTVLVAELRGFSALANEMGSEKVFALLNDYFSTMIDIVLRNRGSLEKSTNESVVAVFGSASPDSHQERHAVEAGITMHHELERILHEWKIEQSSRVALQIGIHTDQASTRDAGGREELNQEDIVSINRIAEQAKDQGKGKSNSLILSSASAKVIQPVFPMSKLEGSSGEGEFFQVTMAKPSLA